ncbi:MAG: S26 family signal peptidase [Candidatus Contendobacter sp.]|nr:MAG: S26 family signal peptidase [Candidatus Contendobacter sp.]
MSSAHRFYAAYAGPSMNPTLVEPELIEIEPYYDRPVRVGDVVFFTRPDEADFIVHRVVRITAAGLRTRGDDNSQDDADWLQISAIHGQVVAAWWGQRRRVIAGGRAGWLLAQGLRVRRFAYRLIARSLRRPYHALARWGFIRTLAAPWFKPQVIAFSGRSRYTRQLWWGQRLIGNYDAQVQQWRIRHPYRLWVDAAALPAPAGGGYGPPRWWRRMGGIRRYKMGGAYPA